MLRNVLVARQSVESFLHEPLKQNEDCRAEYIADIPKSDRLRIGRKEYIP